MARTVKGPAANDVREFIPESDGNREDSDPVKVWIRNPTEADRRRIEAGGAPVRIDGKKISVDLDHLYGVQETACRMCIEKVENYNRAGGIPIETGDDFAKHGEADFVAEVYMEIMGALSLSEAEGKPLAEPLASTSEENSPDGTAASVNDSAGTPTATVTIPEAIPVFDTSPAAD